VSFTLTEVNKPKINMAEDFLPMLVVFIIECIELITDDRVEVELT